MRNIHLIEQFMKENNLKFDKPFIVKWKWWEEGKEIEKEGTVKFVKYGEDAIDFILVEGFNSENPWTKDDDINAPMFNKFEFWYDMLFSNRIQIVTIPWKPQNYDKYYFIDMLGRVKYKQFSDTRLFDVSNLLIGNCFEKNSDAQKNYKKIKNILHHDKQLINLDEVE